MKQATRKLSTSKHTQHVKFVQQLHRAVCWNSCSVTHSNSRLYLLNVSPCTTSEMTENWLTLDCHQWPQYLWLNKMA